ncbi:unnamed protein product [Vicia faba]|uniref:Uncharacterized protein n=1 Tax=Vicia faba TaxID=3906 RepID=A0AAV1BC19_VICFA|nr:unnamed protein product [Vicia faba]
MDGKNNTSWIEMDDDDDEKESTSSNSNLSSSSSLNLNGSLYELSELLKHLPIKRGLSMFYQGKAQSFGSLARVKSIEDLAKKNKPNYRSKVKSCKNFGLCTTKATIAKKSSRRTSFSITVSKKKSFLGESS